uniref:Uncharacterized protein n=1 Tax=Timema douglasi TaxID=61478 RepID=A0A7R8VGK5_TIMDO|nr:unnamed protein product [Timema douglasi]
MDKEDVEKDSLQSWVELLSSQPRSAQLLVDKHNYLLNTLKTGMNRYLKEVKASYLTPDKRDPEFVFYDVTKALVNVYR